MVQRQIKVSDVVDTTLLPGPDMAQPSSLGLRGKVVLVTGPAVA